MSLTATDSGGAEFTITPAGQYIARLYRLLDLGTQTITSQVYGTSDKHQVMLSWELIGDDDPKMEDGRPYSVHATYTVSLHEKSKLRADLESWRGRKFTTEELTGFDLSKVMGQYCMIQVVHDQSGKYANVQTIMSYKGDKPKPVNENLVFDIDKPDVEVMNKLSENMQAKITNTPEWAAFENPPKPEISKTNIQKQQTDMGTFDDEEVNLDEIPF